MDRVWTNPIVLDLGALGPLGRWIEEGRVALPAVERATQRAVVVAIALTIPTVEGARVLDLADAAFDHLLAAAGDPEAEARDQGRDFARWLAFELAASKKGKRKR